MNFSNWKFLRKYFYLLVCLTLNIVIASNGSSDRSIVSTCDDFGACSQKCVMISGQAKCSCVDFFQLQNDSKTCAPNDPSREIIFVTSRVIYSLRTNENDFNNLLQQSTILKNILDGNFADVTNDVRNNYVYVNSKSKNYRGVFRMNANNTGEPKIVVDVGTYLPAGVAFDWITGNVYFADYQWDYIAVCDPRLSQCAKIVDEAKNGTDDGTVTGIALHPNEGIMFWTDWGTFKTIKRASMDGSNIRTIVSTRLLLPYDITVDEASSRIYWTDAGQELIETARFDGSDRREIARSRWPMGIDIFGDMVYWTDWSANEVIVVNKFGRDKSTLPTAGNPRGLTVMHISKQPKLRINPCENLQCSHVCALSLTTAQCLCPVGMIKNANNCLYDYESHKLLLAIGNVLLSYQIGAIGRNVFEQVQLPNQIKVINAIIYNPINKTLIISDDVSKNIVEYKLDSQDYVVLVQTDLINVTSLEMDAIGENLFWYDAGKLTLEVMSMRTGARAVLKRNLQNIHDILFVYDEGALYISQIGVTGAQEDIRKLVFSQNESVNYLSVHNDWHGLEPVKLAYDKKEGKVLGVFGRLNHVFVQSIYPGIRYASESNQSVLDAVQINNQMFWADTTDEVKVRTTVLRDDSFTQAIKINWDIPAKPSAQSLSRKKLASLQKMTSSLEQLRYSHPCSFESLNRKVCSHICLPTENPHLGVCWCPSQLQLGVDGLICIDRGNGNKMRNQSTHTTGSSLAMNTTSRFSFRVETRNNSIETVAVYITVPICLIITMIVVGVVIYLLKKRNENEVSLLPKPFNAYDIM